MRGACLSGCMRDVYDFPQRVCTVVGGNIVHICSVLGCVSVCGSEVCLVSGEWEVSALEMVFVMSVFWFSVLCSSL